MPISWDCSITTIIVCTAIMMAFGHSLTGNSESWEKHMSCCYFESGEEVCVLLVRVLAGFLFTLWGDVEVGNACGHYVACIRVG